MAGVTVAGADGSGNERPVFPAARTSRPARPATTGHPSPPPSAPAVSGGVA